MSTKNRLIELIERETNNECCYVATKRLIEEYRRKGLSLITKELLLRNGFKSYPGGIFEYYEDSNEFVLEWDKGGCYWCDTVLHNVADLEDALDLCRLRKEIQL